MPSHHQLTIGPAPLPSPEVNRKALRKAEINPFYVELGGCIEEVRRVSGMGLEEFATAIGKNDPRQVARQIKGEERPQIEVVFAVQKFRGPLVVALARLASDVELFTEIRVRRSA